MRNRRKTAVVTLVLVAIATVGGAPSAAAGGEGRIAFARQLAGGGAQILTINPDGSGESLVPVEGMPEDWASPVWSPDGSRLLIANNLVLDENGECCRTFRPATVDPDGSDYKLIDSPELPEAGMFCHAWSAGTTRLLCGVDSEGSISIRSTDGGDVRWLTTNPFGSNDVPWSLSPDGQRFAFLRYRPGPMPGPRPFVTEQVGIFVANIDGSDVRQVVPYGVAEPHEFASASWSPDGKMIMSTTTRGRIFVVRLDGSGLNQLTLEVTSKYFAYDPAWSPRGDRIVFTMFVNGQSDVYVADRDGSHLVQLTNTPDFEDGPNWGPTGS